MNLPPALTTGLPDPCGEACPWLSGGPDMNRLTSLKFEFHRDVIPGVVTQ